MQHFPHRSPQLSLQAASCLLLKSKLLTSHLGGEGAADRQAAGTRYINSTSGNGAVLPGMSSVKAPPVAPELTGEVCCRTPIVYLKRARKKYSSKVAEIWDSNLLSVNHLWFKTLRRTQEPRVSSWIYSLLLPASVSSPKQASPWGCLGPGK